MAAIATGPVQIIGAEEAEAKIGECYREEDGTFLVVHHKGPSLLGFGNEITFSWGFGPLVCKGVVNTALLSLSGVLTAHIPFIGSIKLAELAGDLKTGIETGINVFVAEGRARLYLKDGNQIWLSLELSSKFFPTIKGEYKLITIF
ncbi:hypothetical protein RhiJN_01268 [Ceratobasidium sp. AG-Ba]|nr:hypothetical protein RhiJN_01268 [Ceratobasidium sp. AG-Ba]QRW02295.1 hypothetical protein RhiLY_01293 [Ceratobasidium sp. AG-Ba]